ncbi:MAG: CopG family transcriptional regulator [Acidobacteriota bacterium]
MSRLKSIFTLDENIIAELDNVAKELNEKKSHIVEKALNLYFDLLDVKIADKRMDDILSGKTNILSFEDVEKELGN